MLKALTKVAGQEYDDGWKLYTAAFRELNGLAVQRHMMHGFEFNEVMTDKRVLKYLYFDDDGVLCGLSTFTNQLQAMPLISPDYFQRRWPKLYAEYRIWYCGFVAVHPHLPAFSAFSELVEAMYKTAAETRGVIALDLCSYNVNVRHMPKVIALMLRRLAGNVRVERMDEQSYWLYDFPESTQDI